MDDKNTVEIHYQKNPQYRTIHCDGAVGGYTPMQEFNINFYSTRQVIPKVLKFELDKEGRLGQVIDSEGKNGIVREIEFGVYMTPQAAKEIYEFLKKHFDGANK